MTLSKILLATGVTLAGAYFLKSSRGALPKADGPVSGETDGEGGRTAVDELQRSRPAALEAGMPSVRNNDADDVRPGFVDYARGA